MFLGLSPSLSQYSILLSSSDIVATDTELQFGKAAITNEEEEEVKKKKKTPSKAAIVIHVPKTIFF